LELFEKMIPLNRILCIVLAGFLALSSLPVSSSAQEASLSPVSSSTDSDNTNDDVLIGFLVVVVGILLWLGLKSDLDRRQRSAVQESIEEYAAAGTLPLVAGEEGLFPDQSDW
jgi:hypothetical protein